MIYNRNELQPATTTQFSTGAPVHPMDLRFRRTFLWLLLDLENDFYVVEVGEGHYDFASGVLKSWWRKYHA